ncbi:MAG: hypothetical protein OIF57_08305, partial [Marinobacterium sp.]|nr:hypothetical protein [Marinobacterium sp.]
EQDQLAVLKAELDKPVAERQEGASDAQLNAQISEITGVRTFDQLSTEEQTQVNKLHVQIAELAPAEAARLNGEDFANIPVDSMPPVEVVAGFEVSAFEGRDDPAWANIGNPNISQMGEYTFDLEAMMSGGVEHVDEGIYIIGQPVGMDDAVIEVL